MEENRNPLPPPIPVRSGRPGRAVRSIETLKKESKPNEYVDTDTISGALNKPKLPPKLHKSDKTQSLDLKTTFTKDIETCENVTNEWREREQLQGCKLQTKSASANDFCSPELPPRKPPTLPPRDSKMQLHEQARPTVVTTQPRRVQHWPTSKTEMCNSTSSSGRRNHLQRQQSSHQHQVLIITEESRRFPHFTTSRSNKKDSLLASAPQQPVVQQPQASAVTLTLSGASGTLTNTIICQECGKCRCADCTGDRKLPERWLCEGNCRCSAESVVDTVSCMCCFKSCFKGCIDNPDGAKIDPCSCTDSPTCLLRWTALAALSLCLPCLCCYAPLQLGVCAATSCYNSSCCRKRGCNCENH